ncbi:MAG: anthranilate phosphoribosyltransferase [Planctomycetota bacterium]
MPEEPSVLLEVLPLLARGSLLTRTEAARVMSAVISAREPVSRVAALLAILKVRSPTADEIAGFVDTLLAAAIRFPLPPGLSVDTCGTGGDQKRTFNISTTTALVVAACGVAVVKHGNRSASGRCGSADLLEHLGVKVEQPIAATVRQLHETGFAFLFAPAYHPVLRQVASLRREIGFPTVFNVLGPLLNPARVRHQLLGVFDPGLQPLMARTLALCGTERAYALHGEGGFDEATPCGRVSVHEVHRGSLRAWELDPAELGIARCAEADLVVANAHASAALALDVLADRASPCRDAVVLNAALALHVAGAAASLGDAAELARQALASGRALGVLNDLRKLSAEAG